MGVPGAGKGALSQLIAQRKGWPIISAGDLCRFHVKNGTEIGKKIDFAIKSGNLISDQLITDLVREELVSVCCDAEWVILDGYPRTEKQVEHLAALQQKDLCGVSIKVVRIVVPDQVVLDRLLNRAVCENQACKAVASFKKDADGNKTVLFCQLCGSSLEHRSDDTEETIKKRLAIYHLFEQGLIERYRTMGYEVIDVDGNKSLDQVYECFLNRVVGQQD